MSDEGDDVPPLRDVLIRIEKAVGPVYEECFSEQTVKARNQLLVTSVGLILILLDLGEASDAPETLRWLSSLKTNASWAGALLCLYFEIVVGSRSYIDWVKWRLRHQAPAFDLLELRDQLLSAHSEVSKRINANIARSAKLVKQMAQAYETPDRLNQIASRMMTLFDANFPLLSEQLRLGRQLHALERHDISKREQLEREYNAVFAKIQANFAEVEDLRAQEDMISAQHEAASKSALADIEREQNELMRQLDFATSPDVRKADALGKRLTLLRTLSRPVSWTFKARLFIEALFPLIVGLAAMLMGALVALRPLSAAGA